MKTVTYAQKWTCKAFPNSAYVDELAQTAQQKGGKHYMTHTVSV